MAEPDWSPEPWHTDARLNDPDDGYAGGFYLFDSRDEPLATFFAVNTDIKINEDMANAARVVACVNYLAGCAVPTEGELMTTRQVVARALLRGDDTALLAAGDLIQETVAGATPISAALSHCERTLARLLDALRFGGMPFVREQSLILAALQDARIALGVRDATFQMPAARDSQ